MAKLCFPFYLQESLATVPVAEAPLEFVRAVLDSIFVNVQYFGGAGS